MQLAIVDGERREAFPQGRGECPVCGAATIAKCGPRIMHHWAHHNLPDCDPWWENETQWHRDWKNLYPLEYREIAQKAPDGEVHRADIITPTGIVIEVQHSAMTDAERHSREAFYKNLVWIVDGRGFKDQFDLHHLLPDPDNKDAQDLVWAKAARGMNGANAGIFWRLSENPDLPADGSGMVQIHGAREVENLMTTYRGHQQYSWTRPRKTWLDAQCPVYIDFGDEWLFQLQKYGPRQMRCVYRVAKRKFLHDSMVETDAWLFAARFYPICSR